MARIDIVPFSRAEAAKYSPRALDWPIIAYAIRTPRGHLVAFGGLCWRFTNPGETRPRCDLFLDVTDRRLMRACGIKGALTLVRWARRMIRVAQQFGEGAVYCIRDDEPNSEKLLTLAGLRLAEIVTLQFDDGTSRPGEIWSWQRSRQ